MKLSKRTTSFQMIGTNCRLVLMLIPNSMLVSFPPADVCVLSEEPTYAQHPVHIVQSKVWRIHAGVGQVQVPSFHPQGHIVRNEPAHAGRDLKVKLESVRQIRWTNARGRHTGTRINIGHPASAAPEVV